MIRNLIIICICCLGSMTFAQSPSTDPLPRVFMIGEHETEYESTVLECQSLLLQVCNNSMPEAYDKWMVMLGDMEGFSERSGFDLKGLKIWINVFWNNDGTIKHIVYYPKPNSRNMDFEELTSFFYSFIGNYQLPLEYQNCYSHFGSASFPTFAKIVGNQEK